MNSVKLSIVAAGLLSAVTLSAPAHAGLVSASPACTNGGALTAMEPDALACIGSFDGNDVNQQADVLAELASAFTPITGSGTWAYGETVNVGASGSIIQSVPGTSAGTISFVGPVTDFFGLTLKTANQFSVYLFDGGTNGISSIDFTTIGTSLNPKGEAQDLSHASMWNFTSNEAPPVPLPAGVVLLASALAGVGLLRRLR